MKKYLILFAIIVIAAAIGAGYFWIKGLVADDSDEALREAISKEVVIYSEEITSDITVENKPQSDFERFTEALKPGSREVIVPVAVTVKAAINCSEIKNLEIDKEARTVRLTLPEPKYQTDNIRIDWENMEEHVSWMRSGFSKKEISDYVNDAVTKNKSLIDSKKSQLSASAKANAMKTIKTLAEKLDYTVVK